MIQLLFHTTSTHILGLIGQLHHRIPATEVIVNNAYKSYSKMSQTDTKKRKDVISAKENAPANVAYLLKG